MSLQKHIIKNDFTIGTDAEFIISSPGGNLIEANKYTPSGPMGADGYNYNNNGGDGNSTWEIRSKPSTNPVEIIHNIREIFSDYVAKYPQFLTYNWEAGSYVKGRSIGLHVHFGDKEQNFNTIEDITYFLSNYVGLISLLLEDEQGRKNRRKSGDYGFFNDYRQQPWGWEYRSMSSSLASPYVTNALLCLSKTVVYEYRNNKDFQKELDYINEADFVYGNINLAKENFPKVWADITKMQLYQVYKPYIDILYFLVTNNLTWFPKNQNMKEAWGLTDVTLPLGGVDLETIWFKYNKNEKVVKEKIKAVSLSKKKAKEIYNNLRSFKKLPRYYGDDEEY